MVLACLSSPEALSLIIIHHEYDCFGVTEWNDECWECVDILPDVVFGALPNGIYM